MGKGGSAVVFLLLVAFAAADTPPPGKLPSRSPPLPSPFPSRPPPPDICKLDPEEGNCEEYTEQFFYNSTSKACEIFTYGGCDGNGNRFFSEEECNKKCGDKDKPRNCSQVDCPSLECEYIRPANPEKGRCCPTCVERNQTNCSAVVECPPLHCPNPIPANHTAGKCCATCPPGPQCPVAGQVFKSCASPCNATCSNPAPFCVLVCQPGCACPSGQVIDTSKNKCVPVDNCPGKPRNCSDVECPPLDCAHIRPANPENGRCCPTCVQVNQTNCSAVVYCPPLRCPNPIPANHTQGECCASCPEGSQCPVAGQVFKSCASPCNATCSDPSPFCVLVCQPGCACPSGQVIDTRRNRCVPVDSCSINQTNCSAVLNCPPPRCPNPIPANHTQGKCCASCPEGSQCPVAGQVFKSCASPCNATCSDPSPFCILVCQPGCACPSGQVIDQRRNRCVPVDSCSRNQTNCSAVVDCPAPRCPNPIPANHTAGKCCATCPQGSQCPVAGQVFQNCASPCNATCSNPSSLCILVCQPGCACPSGQVIDTRKNRCVPVDSCPVDDICQLPAEKGNCRAKMTRYYYNSDAGKCQQFAYGGCNGNENNFLTMRACQKECEQSSIDCSAVTCAVPTCPDPIAPNPAEGECCSKCPEGSTCPFKGQVYHECIGCPPTCANYDQIVPCPLICLPGCACPTGTVLDEQSSTCVAPEKCPGKCELHPEVGVCRGAIPRYFYNATSKQCEKFIYGGCGGNENNFETLSSCLNNCSECAPACTPDFCKGKLQAKCSIRGNAPGSGSCFGGCDETICSACYYSNETLLMPTLEEDCPTLCPVDAKGEIFGMTCLKDWGKCVRSANLDTYGKPTSEMKTAENFKCWRPSCQSHA